MLVDCAPFLFNNEGMQHHAVCIAKTEFESLGLSGVNGQAELREFVFDLLGITEARELSRQAHLRPANESQQLFVVRAEQITVEAQNALLKLFEEPPLSTQFYIVVPKPRMLLPTLQSRLQFSAIETGNQLTSDEPFFQSFLQSTYGERLDQVGVLAKQSSVEQIELLVSGAEAYAKDTADETLLSAVLLVRSYIGNRGSSTKMLLESLALALPRG